MNVVMFWVVRLFWGERPAWGLEFPGSGRGDRSDGQSHALGQVHPSSGRVPARGLGARVLRQVPLMYPSGAAVLRTAHSSVGKERQSTHLKPKGEAGPEATVCQGEAKLSQVLLLKWN